MQVQQNWQPENWRQNWDERQRYPPPVTNRRQYCLRKTALYQNVYRLAEQKAGKTLPREMLPGIQLESPKITRNLTTAWFAKRVDDRRAQCMLKN
jgi:hypothetical protein